VSDTDAIAQWVLDYDGRIEVEVHDVYKDAATATVRSATYHEYVHLVRTSEGWRIANALWQLT